MDEKPELPPGFTLAAYDDLDSTNEEAKRLADDGAAEGLVVWARRQNAGRGRRGRSWHSPEGGLYCSLLVRPECTAGEAAQLSFAAAVAMAEALDPVLPEPSGLTLKWPNDVLLKGRKVCGILLEAASRPGEPMPWLVVGVGVNISARPAGVETSATSLADEGARETSPALLLAQFVGAFARWLERWQTEGFAPVRQAWLARAAVPEEPIRAALAQGSVEGRFLDLDETGALILEAEDGTRHTVAAGDVYYPGPG